ncbi:MAG: dehydrogenase [Paludibacteraceae bacterium]|nr:dehydrogenase [Paludibacteraceae bacterium]
MKVRSKAPLRLGLAGGGSDVSPYSDIYGGYILNATINLYAHCTIEENTKEEIEIYAADLDQSLTYPVQKELPIDGNLDLHKGVFNRIIKNFDVEPKPFRITTYSDAPAGSGLGSSSTMVVCILQAFAEWYNLPLGDYEIAHLAYEIERVDIGLSGGKQDQYAATFGGFNFMEFLPNGHVIVNPLRIKPWIVEELEASLLLFFTGASRSSAKIIDEQRKNTIEKNSTAIEAMHKIKQSAIDMKTAILKGEINSFASILGRAWEDKKKMANSITNPMIQKAFDIALNAGAIAGKVSGAGGGGFIMFVVEPTKRKSVEKALSALDGRVVEFQFSDKGTQSWKILDLLR